MKKTEFSYLCTNRTAQIHGCFWEPESEIKGVIQIAHGITEHMGRYEEFAAYFTQRGYAVAGNDHLGHGLSLEPGDPVPMYFGKKGSWQYVVQDIKTCTEKAKERYPGVPYCLLGFSLGSFAVRCLLGEEPDLADRTIWAGTGQTNKLERAIGNAVCSLEERRFGDTRSTPLIHKLTMETYNQKLKPCRTDSDWICATPEAVDAYRADPLCGKGFTVGSFRELLSGMGICSTDDHVAGMNKAMPVLLISGAQDPVGSFGKGVEKVERQLKKHGFSQVSMRLFGQMRHDIFREREKELVFSVIEHWLETTQIPKREQKNS